MKENQEENFTIIIDDEVEDALKQTTFQNREGLEKHLQTLFNEFNAISTGNQYGAGSTEYFFYVEPGKLQYLQNAIESSMNKEGLQHYIHLELE
jgi:hypothetical protein